MKALNRLTVAIAVATASIAAVPTAFAADCELLLPLFLLLLPLTANC